MDRQAVNTAQELRRAAEILRGRDDSDADSWSLPCNQNPHTATLDADLAAALAVWLDATAERVDAGRPRREGGRSNHSWRGSREAFAVARLVNGNSR